MLRAGDQVGNYEVEALVGAGGMASVYRAVHTSLGSQHAIKMLNAELAENATIRDRFLHEGRVLAQVLHPGLRRVTEVVQHDGYAGLVMDLLDGEDLAVRLEAGPLSVEVAAGLMLQVLSAVGHAHRAGVVHRDLKPANLFLVHRPGKLPLVKVLDFGVAKLRGLDVTRGAQAMGTVAYMSPEQIEHPADVDPRSDLFSLGVVLYEMVTGDLPFEGDTDFAVMQNIVGGRVASLPESAGLLEPVVQRALQVRREDRFPDAASFAEVLRGLAPPDIRHMVAEWENEGPPVAPAEPTRDRPRPAAPKVPDALGAARAAPVSMPPPLPPTPPPGPAFELAAQRIDAAVTEAETRSIARWAGMLQLVSGLINLLFMGVFQFLNVTWCPIFGLPAVFGLLLWAVGVAEILSGFSAIATGNPSTLRRTAHLEVLSFAGLGLISGFVGMYVLSLRRRYPGVLP